MTNSLSFQLAGSVWIYPRRLWLPASASFSGDIEIVDDHASVTLYPGQMSFEDMTYPLTLRTGKTLVERSESSDPFTAFRQRIVTVTAAVEAVLGEIDAVFAGGPGIFAWSRVTTLFGPEIHQFTDSRLLVRLLNLGDLYSVELFDPSSPQARPPSQRQPADGPLVAGVEACPKPAGSTTPAVTAASQAAGPPPDQMATPDLRRWSH